MQRTTAIACSGVVLCLLCFLAPVIAVFRSIRPAQAALMTGQCHVLSSLSSVVIAFLCYYFLAWLVRDHVLPVCFTERLKGKRTDDERARWRGKIVSLLLPIAVRSLCLSRTRGRGGWGAVNGCVRSGLGGRWCGISSSPTRSSRSALRLCALPTYLSTIAPTTSQQAKHRMLRAYDRTYG